MQQAMHKLWNTYSDAELQLLLRFAKEGYKAALQATEVLNTLVNDGVKKACGAQGAEASAGTLSCIFSVIL